MKRLLVLNHYPVLPVSSGGQQAVLGLTTGLARDFEVELVWTQRKTDTSQRMERAGASFTVTAVPNRWVQRKLTRLLRPGLGVIDADMGTMLCSAGNRRLVQHLLHVLRDGDVLLLAHPWLWPAAHRVLQQRKLLLVYDAHNVEHLLKAHSLRPGATADWALRRVRQLEADVVARADLTLACTAGDAAVLSALAAVPSSRMHVGSKGIDASPAAAAVQAQRAARAPGRVAIFVGSDHPPNNEAARWIMQTLAPACPHWQFHIAGPCGPAAAVANPAPNVTVLGRVPDLLGALSAADVALNPIVQGSGINMKLFEYLQCGLPAVTTAFGARGFEALANTGLVLAERSEFPAVLAALEDDPGRRLALGAAGAACVAANFEWPVIASAVSARIQQLLKQRFG